MKKTSIVAGLVIALGLVLGSPVYGAEGKAKGKGCTECDSIKGKVEEKKKAMEALKAPIKTVKDAAKAKHEAEKAKKQAEKAAKLEALKKSNPEKYAKLMEKQASKKKDGEKKNVAKKDGEKKDKTKMTPEQKAAKLEKVKTKNPELYNLLSQRLKLQSEMKSFKAEFKTCKTACKTKKG